MKLDIGQKYELFNDDILVQPDDLQMTCRKLSCQRAHAAFHMSTTVFHPAAWPNTAVIAATPGGMNRKGLLFAHTHIMG